MSLPSPRRVFLDSLPIAGIMVGWVALSWLGAHPLLGQGLRIAGLVMALMYAIVKGISSASRTHSAPELADAGSA